ncbi:hypothetical protein F8388_022902 [Cannabis sativa]|uniref:Pentatricopeptide repeat-containing protein n=1 Tax=Cannabis sativa TaxID=3483 RepID=A0A7J6FEX1_CANSA|nr:hypothetical protein F8388_022902 [Cannabis sativa]
MLFFSSSLRLAFPSKLFVPQKFLRFMPVVHGGGASFKWGSSLFSQMAVSQLNSSSASSDEDNQLDSSSSLSSSIASHETLHLSPDLDSFRVVEILRSLRAEPDLAIAFFHRSKEEAGFRHEISAYVELVKILCYWGLDRKLDSLFRDIILPSKEQPGGPENLPFLISEFLLRLEEELEVGQSLFRAYNALVKSYVSVAMFDDAIDVLFQTRRKGFVPHIFTCNYLLNRLIEHGKMDMAVAIYKQLKRIGLSPNDYTHAIVIKALCKKGALEEAADVFLEMEKAGLKPSPFAYSAYIEGLCTNHSVCATWECHLMWQINLRNSKVWESFLMKFHTILLLTPYVIWGKLNKL